MLAVGSSVDNFVGSVEWKYDTKLSVARNSNQFLFKGSFYFIQLEEILWNFLMRYFCERENIVYDVP